MKIKCPHCFEEFEFKVRKIYMKAHIKKIKSTIKKELKENERTKKESNCYN